jgi:predicted nucleic-acid-binding Zn-ribbon protein
MHVKMTKCPKCTSTNVFEKTGGIGWGRLRVALGSFAQETGDSVTYLCTNCGYFEIYLTHLDWLAKIKSDPESVGWHKSE